MMLTRCSSTPSAEILVKATGSTTRTFARSTLPPPQPSSSIRLPGLIFTASVDSTSTTTS